MTLSSTQLRRFGAGGFRYDGLEEEQGCPRQYHARYVAKRVEKEDDSFNLVYGRVVHAALADMENGTDPEEALAARWDTQLGPEAYAEALGDLRRYLEKTAPDVQLSTIGVEMDMSALLYTDPEHGGVFYRGLVDYMGIDGEGVVHVIDYKTNRGPPNANAVRGDAQMRGYAWLAMQQMRKALGRRPEVVVHLAAIKWRDIPVRYTLGEVDAWAEWAQAVARTILRDEEAAPKVNPGCPRCPVKVDCPAYDQLAHEATTGPPEELVQAWRWRQQAQQTKGLLDKGIKAVDARIADHVAANGPVILDDTRFAEEPAWRDEVDTRAAHSLLGDRFYDLVSLPKTTLEKEVKEWDASSAAELLALVDRLVDGTKIARRKAA